MPSRRPADDAAEACCSPWIAIPLTLVILTALVVVHELGHFVTARLSGIRVLEFGIGFPPRAKVLGHDHETEYTLNYLPIGGFCLWRARSRTPTTRAPSRPPSLPRQILVMVAGVTMNLLTAVFLFFIVACVFSPGQGIKFAQVIPGSAAQRAGLVGGETIDSVNGQRFGFMTSTGLLDAISRRRGQDGDARLRRPGGKSQVGGGHARDRQDDGHPRASREPATTGRSFRS